MWTEPGPETAGVTPYPPSIKSFAFLPPGPSWGLRHFWRIKSLSFLGNRPQLSDCLIKTTWEPRWKPEKSLRFWKAGKTLQRNQGRREKKLRAMLASGRVGLRSE